MSRLAEQQQSTAGRADAPRTPTSSSQASHVRGCGPPSIQSTTPMSAARWERWMAAGPPIRPVSPEEAKAARLSPRLVQSLRKRLGLSQMALARLVGVSAAAVAHWEAGNSAPTGQNRVTVVALRKVGKREVKELLHRVKGTAARVSRPRRRRAKKLRRKAKT